MRTGFLALTMAASANLLLFVDGTQPAGGETLYNGIVLPREWPPRLSEFPTSVEKDPVVPPYLVSPPAVIPIDIGRQLFVDDFLIADTTLKRTFHLAKYHPESPVLKPDKPWEMKNPDHAAAMVFSDGVWYDPGDKLFKMWYLGGESAGTGYATSRDGIKWDKPSLDVRPGTNIVQPGGRDSSTVWLDLEEKDPSRRFKMFRVVGAGEDALSKWNNWAMEIHFSADGIHWGEPVAKSGRVVDRSTVFWNPFRKVWVYSIRHVYATGSDADKSYGFARRRSYHEGPDILAAARWEVNEPLRWTDVDRLDPQRDDLKIKPQLYNLDAVAYESLMVGFFTIWRGQPADRHKPNNVVLGYSRDGWHWSRPDRRAFCPVSDKQGDWNANNVQSGGGGFLVVGDELYFYVSGRTGRPGNNKAGTLTTGLAVLRRDGFASMDADETGGTLTTRPVRFAGKHLFVNVDNPNGELRVEILNETGEVVAPFTAGNCVPVAANKTLQPVEWKAASDLSSLENRSVRFRFHMKNGKLYAFWVSPESSGASQGYVAAGGPGFSSNRDTGRKVSTAAVGVSPRDGATGVNVREIVEVHFSEGLTLKTITPDSIRLLDTAGVPVRVRLGSDIEGDVVNIRPDERLTPGALYTLEVNGKLVDKNGVPVVPFRSAFTTGADLPAPINGEGFPFTNAKVDDEPGPTAIAVGPDGHVYVATYYGNFYRLKIDPETGLSIGKEKLLALPGERKILGLAFDPEATSSNLVAWITHDDRKAENVDSGTFSGVVSRLLIPASQGGVATQTPFITGLPSGWHPLNGCAFGPDQRLYISTGSMNRLGHDPLRPETPLSAAVVVADVRNPHFNNGRLPLNVQTTAPVNYDPHATNSLLKIHATGFREMYSLCWHTNGNLYGGVNQNDGTGRADTPASSGVPSLHSVFPDEDLVRIVKGGYYGHPNPSRRQYVLLGGNPTAEADPWEAPEYPAGVQPDPDFDPANLIFNLKSINGTSADGCAEYTLPGPLQGRLLICFFEGTHTVHTFAFNRDGTKVTDNRPLLDENNESLRFTHPIGLAVHPAGRIYVADFGNWDSFGGGGTIRVLHPTRAK